MIDLTGQSMHVLTDVLDTLAPVELEGMQLLTRLRPVSGSLFPPAGAIDRETLCRATSEMIDYTGRCHTLRNRLMDANPVPLSDFIVMGFGL